MGFAAGPGGQTDFDLQRRNEARQGKKEGGREGNNAFCAPAGGLDRRERRAGRGAAEALMQFFATSRNCRINRELHFCFWPANRGDIGTAPSPNKRAKAASTLGGKGDECTDLAFMLCVF